jgi:hypothetical protein
MTNKIKPKQIVVTTSIGNPGVDTNIPSEKAVRTALNGVSGSSGISEAPINGTPYVRQNAGWVSATGTSAAGGDMNWSVIQASQLVNEIKGWPPIVNSGDLDALNLWWHKVGTPTTAPTVTDTSADGLTDNYELCLKIVADAAGEGLFQRWTFADEPRVKAGRVISALVAIWSVSAVSVTAKLINSDASHTDASAVTAAAWTIVEIPTHVLAGTYCDLQITAGAAGTFYIVPLGVNIGTRALPLKPRGLRKVEINNTVVVSDVDAAYTWTDADITANTSPNAVMANIICSYQSNTANDQVSVRRNGAASQLTSVTRATTANAYYNGSCIVDLDDGNIFEFIGGLAAHVESIYIAISDFWEWE